MVVLLLVLACNRAPGDAHEHEHGHSHAGDHAVHDEEVEPVAITRWTDRHELFVEFPPPVANQPVRFHAHVTRLDGFQAVVQGAFRVRFLHGGAVVKEASITGVARPGIFTPEGTAPGEGIYDLEMVYDVEGTRDVFECGQIAIGKTAPPADEAVPSSTIMFLKESQWKIPFATAWATERTLTRNIELPAVVEPAPASQSTITAPVAGRVFYATGLTIAEGAQVSAGAVLGTLVPVVTGEDLGQLHASVDQLRIAREQLTRELARQDELLEKGLTTQLVRTEAANRLEANAAQLKAAELRLSRVTAPGQQGGVAIKSPSNAMITHVAARNGQTVAAGDTVLQLVDTRRVLVRARFIARSDLSDGSATPVALRLANGTEVDLAALHAKLVSASPVVDAQTRASTWSVEVPSTPVPLPPGASAVLTVRAGAPVTGVAVPRSAVVEINTRPFVFVQTEGEAFEKRAVVPGITDGDVVQIVSGVAAGERIVTRGAFDIHLSSLMGTVESHRH